jgi:protease-4
MLRFLRLFLALFFSQLLLGVLVLVGVAMFFSSFQPVSIVQHDSILRIPLAGEVIEYPTLPDVPFLRRAPLSQTAILTALDDAADDDRISAVLVDLDSPDLGWGKASELHEALLRFRVSGKQAWAYAPTLEEIDLYIAAACDSVFAPPHGTVYLNGIGIGSMYFKGTLDKLESRANYSRTGAYKSAPEQFLREDMSAEDREQNEWLLDDIWTAFSETMASSRGMDGEAFALALDEAVLSAEDAVQQGVIDGIRQRSELLERFKESDGTLRLVDAQPYFDEKEQDRGHSGTTVAVVHTRGLILRGRHGFHPNFGPILGATSVVEDLEAAVADDDITAIVLRIDSGGGEIVASDMISHAVERASAAKPVVVSMVDLAASGGYMMAYRANQIVASPATLTGSIGMYSGKFNLKGLYNKVGITQDFVTRGRSPLLFSDYADWSAAEESLIARQQWADYDQWTGDIAAHRALTPADVDAVGRGRVWTGRQAVDRGLVDALGDMRRAVEIACELAHVKTGETVRLVHYPLPRSWLQFLLEDGDLLLSAVAESWQQSLRLPESTRWGLADVDVRR